MAKFASRADIRTSCAEIRNVWLRSATLGERAHASQTTSGVIGRGMEVTTVESIYETLAQKGSFPWQWVAVMVMFIVCRTMLEDAS